MAQYRVQATFEITVTAEFTIDDEDELDTLDPSQPEDQQRMHRAHVRAEEIMHDLTLDVHGCDTWELAGIDYRIEAVD
jgi:hypothetical protein